MPPDDPKPKSPPGLHSKTQDREAPRLPGSLRFRIESGAAAGRVFVVAQGTSTTLGRADDNNIVLADDTASVSRYQMEIRGHGDGVILINRSKTRGTFVNGLCVWEMQPLLPGFLIEVGPYRIRVQADGPQAPAIDRIQGQSIGIQRVLQTIRSCARRSSSVMVTGESGTGKSLVARAIHELSGRRGDPLARNCGTLERGQLQELFREAAGGTLILDEVQLMPDQVQQELLDILEISSDDVEASARRGTDVRVVATSTADMGTPVRQIPDEVYYRLASVTIDVPPLRERPEDIPVLVGMFLERLATQRGLPRKMLTLAASKAILERPWNGNVRELRNAVERALMTSGPEIGVEDLFSSRRRPPSGRNQSERDWEYRRLKDAIDGTSGLRAKDAPPRAPSVATVPEADPSALHRVRFVPEKEAVEIDGLHFDGEIVRILQLLREQYLDDQHAYRKPEDYIATKASVLAEQLMLEDEATIRNRVLTFRKRLQAAYLERYGRSIDAHAIIESVQRAGYRLNPIKLTLLP